VNFLGFSYIGCYRTPTPVQSSVSNMVYLSSQNPTVSPKQAMILKLHQHPG